MTRVLSGITPSDEPTLGNYLGAMRNWVADQGKAETFFFVADLHALTIEHDHRTLSANTLRIANLLLAMGIDPQISTIFVQSHVPQHSEMAWLLECTARFGELRRMTQFKDKAGHSEGFRAGLFTYPCLMAGDILLYDVDQVPVGDDQRQHLQLTRDVAERFNSRYGMTFVVPEAVVPRAGARVRDLLHPSRKMSKSSDSPGVVRILDSPDEIARKFKRAETDLDGCVRYDPDSKPGVSNLLEILGSLTDRSPEAVAEGFTQYGPLKAACTEAVIEALSPVQLRYNELVADPSRTEAALRYGADRAIEVATETLKRAQQAIGLYKI